jgi:hypothetical protein
MKSGFDIQMRIRKRQAQKAVYYFPISSYPAVEKFMHFNIHHYLKHIFECQIFTDYYLYSTKVYWIQPQVEDIID